jgi:phosphatidate cytidylyltransferase
MEMILNKANLLKRILSAIVLAPLALLAVYYGGYYFMIFLSIIVITSVAELENLLKAKGIKLYAPLNYLFSLGIVWGFYNLDFNLIIILFITYFVLQNVYELFNHTENSTLVSSAHVFTITYIAFYLGSFAAVRQWAPSLFNITYQEASYINFTILITIWSCDTFAYFGGTLFGKHRLYEKVSPKKSIEGSVIGFIFAFVINYLFCKAFLPSLSNVVILSIGLITGIFAQLGDLIESLYKRDAGIKDSGNTIPGHGGVLDRIDSILFVFPAIFVFFYIYNYINAAI